MVSEELGKSLRNEVDRYTNTRLGALQEEIARLQNQLNEAFTRLLERSADNGQASESLVVAIDEHLRAAHEEGVEAAAAESARTQAASDVAILKAAIDELDEQRSQATILNTLVNRAASFAPRVAFFVIKNEQAIGWRARGLEGTVGDDAVRDISLPLSGDTLFSDVVNSRSTWSGAPGAHAADHQLLNKLGDEPPQRMVVIPLVVRNKAVAVLYADSAALDASAINMEALETLVRVAGMAVELLAVPRPAPAERRPARIQTESPAQPAPETEQPQREEERAPAMQAESQPEAIEVQASESEVWEAGDKGIQAYVEPSPQFAEAAAPPYHAEEERPMMPVPEEDYLPSADVSEVTAEFASPVASTGSGSVVDFNIAPQPSASSPAEYGAPLGPTRRYGSQDADLPVDVSDEEKRLHNDARRFARLLVSEIKLYNEQKVKDGRIEGNLYERLREDIDRSRQMYDKRVALPVAARYDYFHQELVNTLAEGDPSKLGSNYPGATVSASH